MISRISRNIIRKRRHLRLRKTLRGTADRPRISVFRSLRHIYAQCIDDLAGKTIVSACSLDKSIVDKKDKRPFKERAKEVGLLMGERVKEKGITAIVFDRSGYKYHGRIAELAQGLRDAGLEF